MKKLGYLKLNIQTACPPRAAVPVNQGRGFASVFHLSTASSPSVMDATAPAMSAMFTGLSKTVNAQIALTLPDSKRFASGGKVFVSHFRQNAIIVNNDGLIMH